MLEGATQTSSLLGPPLAGVLIATLGAANVLYVDAATFAFSFLTVLLFVPRAQARAAAAEESGGLLAGVRVPAPRRVDGAARERDHPAERARRRCSARRCRCSPSSATATRKSAGWLFAAYGLGGVIGTVVAFQLVTRVDPLDAGVARRARLRPAALGARARTFRSWRSSARIAFTAVCQPLINAPMFGVITTRTPAALLPKVMTAMITLATIAGPLGLLRRRLCCSARGSDGDVRVIAGGVTARLPAVRRRCSRASAAASCSAQRTLERQHVGIGLGDAWAGQRAAFSRHDERAVRRLSTCGRPRRAGRRRAPCRRRRRLPSRLRSASRGNGSTPGVCRSSVITTPSKPSFCRSTPVTTRRRARGRELVAERGIHSGSDIITIFRPSAMARLVRQEVGGELRTRSRERRRLVVGVRPRIAEAGKMLARRDHATLRTGRCERHATVGDLLGRRAEARSVMKPPRPTSSTGARSTSMP